MCGIEVLHHLCQWHLLGTTLSAAVGSTTLSPVSTEEEDGPQCHICLELLTTQPPVMALTCGHVLHSECIQKYGSTIDDTMPKRCPLCNYIIVHPRRVDNSLDVQIIGSACATDTAARYVFSFICFFFTNCLLTIRFLLFLVTLSAVVNKVAQGVQVTLLLQVLQLHLVRLLLLLLLQLLQLHLVRLLLPLLL